MGDGEHGVSRCDRLSNHRDIAEANLRQKSFRLFNGIKAIDSFQEAGNRMRVFLERQGEGESAIRTHDTTDLPEMDERVVPEIHCMHGAYPIEVRIRIGNPIATGLLHLDQNLTVGAPLATSVRTMMSRSEASLV
jgi:hypothetical protein